MFLVHKQMYISSICSACRHINHICSACLCIKQLMHSLSKLLVKLHKTKYFWKKRKAFAMTRNMALLSLQENVIHTKIIISQMA